MGWKDDGGKEERSVFSFFLQSPIRVRLRPDSCKLKENVRIPKIMTTEKFIQVKLYKI